MDENNDSSQLKPDDALYKKNCKIPQRLHFWIKQSTKILESHKNLKPYTTRIPLADLESHQETHKSTKITKP